MKYKVKFRISAENGKKAKYSINIEEGATFVVSPEALGMSGVHGQTICLLKIEKGRLFATGSGDSSIRLNNRDGSKFGIRPGDFVDSGGLSVEFLEVPVEKEAEEESGSTRFVDISEHLGAARKNENPFHPVMAHTEPESKPEPKPEPVTHPVIQQSLESNEAFEPSTDVELTKITQKDEAGLKQEAADLGERIQAASKKGKKGKRELRRLKRLQREVELRRVELLAHKSGEHKTEQKKENGVPVQNVQEPRLHEALEKKNFAPATVQKVPAQIRRPSVPLKEERTELAVARKLFSDELNEQTSTKTWNPQPQALKVLLGAGAVAGIALIVGLAIKGRSVKTEEVAETADPYQALSREPSSDAKESQPVAIETLVPVVATAPIQKSVETEVQLGVDVKPEVEERAPVQVEAKPQPPVRAVAPVPVSYVKERFFTAVESGDLKTAKQLLSNRSVDVNFTLDRQKTPLMLAASKGHLSIVKYFISMRANLNAQDSEGTTALMWATHRGRKEVVEYLLKRGADAGIRRDDGDRAIDIARRWNQYDIVKILKNASASTRSVAGQSGSRSRKKRH